MNDDERAERRTLIQDLMDSPADPFPLMRMVLDCHGPAALTLEALRAVRQAQTAIAPTPELGRE